MSTVFLSQTADAQPATGEKIDPDVTSGHLHHLTQDQQAAFNVFKDILAKAQLYSPDRPHPTHDEPTLLRFLRARRFDPQKAFKQFADAEAWRKKHNVDALYATFPVDEFESARRFYPRWTGRRDKVPYKHIFGQPHRHLGLSSFLSFAQNGLPVYVYRIASLSGPLQKELNSVPPERRYQRIVALYETMTRFVLRLCSHLPHRTEPTPISSVTTIIDLEQISLPSLWSLRSHLQEASALATANYPETLSTIAVVNSPSFFPTVWSWIKPFFDEGTRRKVHVLGKDPGPILRTLIDPKDLPKPYGGELDWKYEDEPALDDAAKAVIGEMPKGPVVFEDGQVRSPSLPSEHADAASGIS